MNSKFFIFFFLLSFLTGCERDFDCIDALPEGYFVEVIDRKEFGLADIMRLTRQDFPELDFDKLEEIRDLFDFDLRVEVTAIAYNTVDPSGNPVTASGIIVRPLDMESRGVIHVPPTTPLSNLEGGSDLLIITEGVFAFIGYTVIIPDLIGSGTTKEVPQPFLFMDNTGRVCYDMHLAAMEYCRKFTDHPLPAETIIFGYSGGATGAISLLRHIGWQSDPPIKVKEVFAGGGVYDLCNTYNHFKKSGYAEYPLAPLLITSFDYWYKLNLDYTRIFRGDLLYNMENWLDRTRNAEQMRMLINPDLHNYMHPDFFSSQSNAEYAKIESILPLHSFLQGWSPRVKIMLGHAKDDLSVPVTESEALYNYLKNKTNVSLSYGSGGHYDYGIQFFVSAILYLSVN
ncbi:MAG: hypothetical protein WC079_01110 [Bacteroidales bacterium]